MGLEKSLYYKSFYKKNKTEIIKKINRKVPYKWIKEI